MFKNKNIFFLIMRYKVKETVSNTSHINCSENKGMTTICISVNIFGPQFVLFMCVSLVDFLHYYNIINQQLRKISASCELLWLLHIHNVLQHNTFFY